MGKFDTHGGYFAPQGYFRINEGGSHEENPNGGVQVGVDQNGDPNVLEENEPVYNDFVFSDNIVADAEILEKYNIPAKYAGKLYSKIADSFVSEAEDRPNDPVSNNGLEAMLSRLAQAQEEQKQIAEQKEIEDEIANMTPEELDELEAMLMQQEAQQQQMPQEGIPAQEQQMYPQQEIVPQDVVPNQPSISPEEEAQQQQMIAQQSMPVMANGGFLRTYESGGSTNSPSVVLGGIGGIGLKLLKGAKNSRAGYAKQAARGVRGGREGARTMRAAENAAKGSRVVKPMPMPVSYTPTEPGIPKWPVATTPLFPLVASIATSPKTYKAAEPNPDDTIIYSPGKMSFTEAFNDAESKGLEGFWFGDTYHTTERNPNVKPGAKRTIDVVRRDVARNGYVIPDSTATGVNMGQQIGVYARSNDPNMEPNRLSGLPFYNGVVGFSGNSHADGGYLNEFNKGGRIIKKIWDAAKKIVKEEKIANKAAKDVKAANKVKETKVVNKPKEEIKFDPKRAQTDPDYAADVIGKMQEQEHAERVAEVRKNKGKYFNNHSGLGETARSVFLPGHNSLRVDTKIKEAEKAGEKLSSWNKAGKRTVGVLEDAGALTNDGFILWNVGGRKLYEIARGAINYYGVPSNNNTVQGVPFGTYTPIEKACGGHINRYGGGGPLEELVKEYVQKTGNFPDPNQYAILQRLANLGTLSDDDYAALDKRFSAGLNTNKVRPAEEFATVNKGLLRRAYPDVYNGGQLDSIVVNPRENDTVYNGGNLDSIFVRPAPDVFDGGQLDSIVVSPKAQRDTLFTSSTELNPITVTAERTTPEESYSTDYLWKNIGNGIGQKQRRVSKGVITVGGKPYDPATRQFLDKNTFSGNGYYIPLYGNFKPETSVADNVTSGAPSSTTGTPSSYNPGTTSPSTPSGTNAAPGLGGTKPGTTSNVNIGYTGKFSVPETSYTDKLIKDAEAEAAAGANDVVYEDDYKTLPVWGQAAEGLNALAQLGWNIAHKADRYKMPILHPHLAHGRLNLTNPVYNPLDVNKTINDLQASNAGSVWGIMNSGTGPSAGANIIALDNTYGKNVGNAATDIYNANNKAYNDIVAAKNNNAKAIADFDYGVNRNNAMILNEFEARRAQNDVLGQRLNYAAQADKYGAIASNMAGLADYFTKQGIKNENLNAIHDAYDYSRERSGRIRYKKPKQEKKGCGGTLLRKYKK